MKITDNPYPATLDIVNKDEKTWICNECNCSNFTQSVSIDDIEDENLSCILCGATEFHLA